MESNEQLKHATLIYTTEEEFQEFLNSSEHAEGMILAEFQERIKTSYSAPAGDNLEHELEKLGLTLQAI